MVVNNGGGEHQLNELYAASIKIEMEYMSEGRSTESWTDGTTSAVFDATFAFAKKQNERRRALHRFYIILYLYNN